MKVDIEEGRERPRITLYPEGAEDQEKLSRIIDKGLAQGFGVCAKTRKPLHVDIALQGKNWIELQGDSEEVQMKAEGVVGEALQLWEALSEVVDPDCLGLWFQTPNESLGGRKPTEVIERGDIDQLWDMVFELQSGMPG